MVNCLLSCLRKRKKKEEKEKEEEKGEVRVICRVGNTAFFCMPFVVACFAFAAVSYWRTARCNPGYGLTEHAVCFLAVSLSTP